jgi:membrane protein DedA with SNARE-associated domain
VSWWLLVLIVFAAPLIDSVVPVVPGEVVVAGAATSLNGGSLPIPAVVVIAAAGSLIGECVVLAVARRMTGTRVGGRLAGGPKAASVRRVLDRWGIGAVVVARFLPGGRTAAAASYALRHDPTRTFVAAAAIGSLVWASYLVAIGSGVAAAI